MVYIVIHIYIGYVSYKVMNKREYQERLDNEEMISTLNEIATLTNYLIKKMLIERTDQEYTKEMKTISKKKLETWK